MRRRLSIEPKVVERSEQPYLGLKGVVTVQAVATIADRLPELFAWLGERGVEPVGAPFFKYDVIAMGDRLEIEVGVPVAAGLPSLGVPVDGDVFADVLPAGRYAVVHHVGHPDELMDVTGALLEWAADQGLEWDVVEAADGEHWGCRLEVYGTDPAEEPDLAKWETDLVFRLAD